MSSAHIVVISGPPASGKTTAVQPLVDHGYCRINRDLLDQQGSTPARTDDCARLLAQLYDMGKETRFVLDNTYGTQKQRALLLQVAKERGIPVDFKVMGITPEQCQFLAARRMLQKYGKLMDVSEMDAHKKTETEPSPNLFPPMVISTYFKKYETPTLEEGIQSVETIPFEMRLGPEYKNRALIFDYDGTLRVTKSGDIYPSDPSDVVVLDRRRDILKRRQAEGWKLLGISNQSGIAKGTITDEQARACFDETNRQMGVDIEYVYCPHAAGPPQCYCRKPMPGWGVHFIEKYKLDPSQCIYVGDMKTDETFSKRCGFKFAWADGFFG